MTKKIHKIIINSSDIESIENCSKRTASERLRDIKTFFNKTEKRHKITFKEYAEYLRIPLEELDSYR
jgi:hypothetical protein